jgi:radical SAM superfamily enzyme YgiQ (UPF0313 family)
MTRPVLLLISPPVVDGQRWWANRTANKPHLASLAGYVRDLVEPRLLELDLETQSPLEALLAEVDRALTPEVALVGLSAWTSMHFLGTRAVAERIRALRPDLPIVIGGHHATAVPDDFPAALCDFLVEGDGEHPLRGLCERLPFARTGERAVLRGAPFDQSNPAHIDWTTYGRPGAKERALWVGTSRGCAFQCSYCVEPGRGANYSRYEVDTQLDILEKLLALHGPSVIAFSDPLFGANRRWLESFLDGLERRNLPLLFWCETRADLMTRDLLERFKRCGFTVDFGLDTGSAAMVQRMHKAALPEVYLSRSKQTLEDANAVGLHHGVYLIFNYPGETPETVAETKAYVDSIGAGGGPMSGWLSAQSFFILPGTASYRAMAEDAARYGTEIRQPEWWRQRGDHHTMATDLLPSAAWRGREEELLAFFQWNEQVNARWAQRYPMDVLRFRYLYYYGSTGGTMSSAEGSLL